MPWHAAEDLISTRLLRCGKNNSFRIPGLQVHLPENVGSICFVKHFSSIRAILHDDEVMFHSAIMGNVQSNFLSSWDSKFTWRKRKISHCKVDLRCGARISTSCEHKSKHHHAKRKNLFHKFSF